MEVNSINFEELRKLYTIDLKTAIYSRSPYPMVYMSFAYQWGVFGKGCYPMTYERYTYSKNGFFMGWSIRQSEYGKYLKQRTDIKDLYLVGQWVFSDFGVAGVMASGYYLAKEILKSEGIDLKKDFTEFFAITN